MDDSDAVFVLGLACALVLAASIFVCAGGGWEGDDDQARHAAESAGLTHVHVVDRVWIGCPEGGDWFGYAVTGMREEVPVRALVCCDWWGSCTVRYR